MKIPKLASATIKPETKPGWKLSFDPTKDPTGRWIHYTMLPGNEVYDSWIGQFQISLTFKCGTASTPLQYSDSLIVPMGNVINGNSTTIFYGALFPAKQYLCEMASDGKTCVPNGLFEEWAAFSNKDYNETACGLTAKDSPGMCDSKCKGGTTPCVSFTTASSCGTTTIDMSAPFGNMTASNEGGDFPPTRTTVDPTLYLKSAASVIELPVLTRLACLFSSFLLLPKF